MFAAYAETLFDETENDSTAGYAQALNAVYDAMKTLPNPPKILGPEPLGIGYNNFQKYANALDASKLDGYAYHLYHAGDGNDNSLNNYLNQKIIENLCHRLRIHFIRNQTNYHDRILHYGREW